MRSKGSILLECLVALAIFVGVASTVYALIISATGAVERTAKKERAADLARSALAKIEAGIETPESLNGPVEQWRDENDGTFDESPTLTPWMLEISTEPSEFEGLVMVTARAECFDPPGSDHIVASFELKQLIRLLSTPIPEARESIQSNVPRPETPAESEGSIESRNRRRGRQPAQPEGRP